MKITRKKFVKEWVKALRSKKYKQTRLQLSTKRKRKDGHYGYCCLGVACEVGRELGIKQAGFDENSAQERDNSLPGEWFKKIMGRDDPYLLNPKDLNEITCSIANDDFKWSFRKISTALEKQYL